jgi:serine/threonine-protein kinase
VQARAFSVGAGQVVAGRYRIDGVVGEGGFGAVYRATQLNLGRTVALKVLLPDLVAHAEMEKRFWREAELAQRLEHPNTVRLFDFGRSDDGIPFIAFELLKGQPLDKLLAATGPLPAARVARIATQALKSLMEAHSLGIVHRDIKPANVFLCDYSGEPDFVKVLDFGIAKALDDGKPGGRGGLTRVGTAVGTPNYMAPEQVGGGAIGPSTDLYSLGLVMSELLTGQVVFKGDSAVQICMEQVSNAPVPHPPDVLKSPLGPIIHRATQKAPERRYASAAEMLREVEAAAGIASAQPGPSAAGASAPPPPAVAYAQTNVFAGQMPNAGQYAAAPQYPAHAGAYPGTPSYPGPMHSGSMPAMHGAPGVAYPPPMYAPMGAAPAPVKQGGGCSTLAVVLAVGGGFVVLAVIALVVLFAIGVSTTSSSGGSSGGSTPPGQLNGRFKDITVDGLQSRVESAGYSVTSRSVTDGSGFSMSSLVVQRAGGSGSVQLLKYQDSRSASLAEDALRQNNQGTVARDDNTVLMVMIFPQDRAAQQALLEKIIR